MDDAEDPAVAAEQNAGTPQWVDDGVNTAVVDTAKPCWWCGKATHCIDLAFEARLCPACHDLAWWAFDHA